MGCMDRDNGDGIEHLVGSLLGCFLGDLVFDTPRCGDSEEGACLEEKNNDQPVPPIFIPGFTCIILTINAKS